MSIEALKSNIEQEIMIVNTIKMLYLRGVNSESSGEQKEIENAIAAAEKQIDIINSSIPLLLSNISLAKKLPSLEIADKPKKNDEKLVSVTHESGGKENFVAINNSDKEEYLKQLQISESSLKSLKKKKVIPEEGDFGFKKASYYVSLSNKFFGNTAGKLVDKGYFRNLKISLKKGNFTILVNSYIATALFTSFISFFAAIFITLFFIFFNLSLNSPFIYSNPDILLRAIEVVWIILLIPALIFGLFFLYPSLEKSSLEKDLDYELPFAAIQMSAIAGSDIEPSNIFKIIATGKEYPAIKQEAKKLINQINLYGYDLITALKNVASASPSKSWAEMLNGISTTIRSGGDLSKYLNTKADSLLFDYKLKREKATKSAETFMDIYISVVIAAPMLMMMLLIMINISGIGISMPIILLSTIIVLIVSTINVVFLVFLHISQRRI